MIIPNRYDELEAIEVSKKLKQEDVNTDVRLKNDQSKQSVGENLDVPSAENKTNDSEKAITSVQETKKFVG